MRAHGRLGEIRVCAQERTRSARVIWRYGSDRNLARWAESFIIKMARLLGCDLGFGLDGAPLNLRSCAFLEIMGTISFAPYTSIFGAKKGVTGAHLLHFRSSLVIWDGNRPDSSRPNAGTREFTLLILGVNETGCGCKVAHDSVGVWKVVFWVVF